MTLGRLEETKLVEAAQTGDIDAFESLVRAHSSAAYAHAMRFFGEKQAAEDVLQEVFIKVYRSLAGFNGQSAFSTWLFRVTRTTCLDMLRSAKRRPLPVDPVDMLALVEADHAPGVIEAVTLEDAMRALSPEDREALSAVTLFGMNYAEAADALNVPVGTVKSRVFRARRTLLSFLGLTKDRS